MKPTIFLLSLLIASSSVVYAAQKQVHKLEQEQETARKRQKTESAEVASTPMDTSYAAPITPAQTTNSSSSLSLQPMEDIDEKLKADAEQRSLAQQEFYTIFQHLIGDFGCNGIDLYKLEKLLKNPSTLNLEEPIKNEDFDARETALLVASRSFKLPLKTIFITMQLLLNAGAQVNVRDAKGWTPLLRSAELFTASSAPFINLLLEHGADITARNQEGKSITDLIGIYEPGLYYKVINNAAIPLLLDLLRAGAPLPTNKEKSEVLFLKAIEQNDAKVITRFIQEGNMDINGVYGDVRLTPLLHAATYNNIPALKTLLGLGASVNKQDEEGDTILHYFVPRKNPDIIKLLIKAGANVNIQNSNGRTPLMEAINSVLTNPQNFTPQTLPVIRALLHGNELYGGTDFTLHDTVSFQKPVDPSAREQNVEVQERSVEDYVEVYPLHDSPDIKRIKRAINKEILKYKLEQATYKRNFDQIVRDAFIKHGGKDTASIIHGYVQGDKGFAVTARTS